MGDRSREMVSRRLEHGPPRLGDLAAGAAALRGWRHEACYTGKIMIRVVTILAMLAVVLPAAAAPIPAVKTAQCPPGHMQSGGYCTPLLRSPPAAVPKLRLCPSGYAPSSNGCVEIRRR
jgi:hypothetical protein